MLLNRFHTCEAWRTPTEHHMLDAINVMRMRHRMELRWALQGLHTSTGTKLLLEPINIGIYIYIVVLVHSETP